MPQLWGFIGTCASVLVILHLFFLTLGLLGTFPSIITNNIWPVIKNTLIGLLVVESLTIVFGIVAKTFLVFFKQVPFAMSTHRVFVQIRDNHIIHQRLFSIYDVSVVLCCLCFVGLTIVQYAYSILSIVSGIVALITSVVVTVFTGFISLARLDIRKISIPFVSKLMEPAAAAFNAALMADHDNTNPIKYMALEWFQDRLQALRKAEVRQAHRQIIPVFVHVSLHVRAVPSHSL
jgi:hypothetical protein